MKSPVWRNGKDEKVKDGRTDRLRTVDLVEPRSNLVKFKFYDSYFFKRTG